jgi:membrane-associated protease RseP (regulator of RpoE activity)
MDPEMSETIEAIPPVVDAPAARVQSRSHQPTIRQLTLHASLFLLTIVTTTIAGIFLMMPAIDISEPPLFRPIDYFLYVPRYYANLILDQLWFAFSQPHLVIEGLVFSGTLLAILMAHEMGHYLACRRYGVEATLPFFIPAPPLFLAGTLGAFIKIKSAIPSRRALLDIGLAGPLAGFVVAVPVAVIGVLLLQPDTTTPEHAIIFNDPLLIRLIARAVGVELTATVPNPCYMSAWIGLLVTSLNLMPVGQLDGGHGTFAVFGEKAHRWISLIAFFSMAAISILGYLWHGSPSGFLYAVLLAVMLRVRHPRPQNIEPLGPRRIAIAVITLIVFALSFWPFPITIN